MTGALHPLKQISRQAPESPHRAAGDQANAKDAEAVGPARRLRDDVWRKRWPSITTGTVQAGREPSKCGHRAGYASRRHTSQYG